MAEREPIDTSNEFLVGTRSGDIQILVPPIGPISKKRALRLAACIVALAEDEEGEFDKLLEAMRNT